MGEHRLALAFPLTFYNESGDAVNRLVRRYGIDDRTLVIFTSDNGPWLSYGNHGGSCRPLREGKGFLYEGGIRVPLIVRWPGVARPATTSGEPVIGMDLHETILRAAGHTKADPKREGQDLRPLLQQNGFARTRPLFFHYPNYAFHRSNKLGAAIRSGRHKLILRYADDSAELYDLEADLSERNDLSASQPELTARLTGKVRAWLQTTGARMPRRVASSMSMLL